jgi:hypothetical protein
MINKSNENKEKEQKTQENKPNEHGGFYFSSFVKIFDPNTNKILVQKRGDS